MFNFFKKYRWEVFLVVIIIVIFFFTRLYNILSLPIFTDEAIYIRWSQIAKQDASWRFISLTDGKQPMYVWIAIILMHLIKDPLLAGRIVSILSGFVTLIGIFFLGKELFRNRWVGILSSVLYAVYPFGLVYDRMALYDSLVAAFAVWGWFFSVFLVRRLNSFTPFVLALVLGGGYLTKSNDFIIGALLPVSVILFDFKKKDNTKKFFTWLGYLVISLTLAYLYYLVLRLSPFYTVIDIKNSIFVYPLNAWIHHPFTFFWSNLRRLWDWFITYITWPLFLVILTAFLFKKSFWREKVIVLIWFCAPFFYLALFGKTIYPRFILFITIPLLTLGAYTIFSISQKCKNRLITLLILLFATSLSIYTDYFILTNFARAPIPRSDLGQYINDWPAGNGVKQAIAFFQQRARNQKLFIATEGTFGLMPYSLEMYLIQYPNITIRGIWPITDVMPKYLSSASKKMLTYVIFYQPCPSCSKPGNAPPLWPLTKIATYQQGIGISYLSIYKVNK